MRRMKSISAFSVLLFTIGLSYSFMFPINSNSGIIISEGELLPSPAALLGEGAIWDSQSNLLYWIDIQGKKFYQYDPQMKVHKEFSTGKMPGTIVPITKSKVVVALEDGLYQWDLETQKGEFLQKPFSLKETERFNDGKCDYLGRLWVGTMKIQGKAGESFLYKFNMEEGFTEMIDSVSISNGITWSGDNKTMYYIDTPTRKVVAYDFDLAGGTISNKRLAVTVPDSLGHPDGMTIDNEDKIWVALWGGYGIGRFDPENGKLLQYVKLPVRNVTSCAFGGKNLDILYITTAKGGMENESPDIQILAGRMFSVKPGVAGVKANYFREKGL